MLSDDELIKRLLSEEDALIERKTANDYRDVLKCAVSFANSLPHGFIGLIYVGVRDDGSIEQNIGTDSIQKKVNGLIALIYPPIVYESRVVRVNENNVVAILVPSSSNRPHFAGPAYVRRGSETFAASEEQFAELIAQRNSLAYELLRWKGKHIKLYERDYSGHRVFGGDVMLVDCNQFYVVLENRSYPLGKIEISRGNESKTLAITVTEAW
jgi:predicted HTH transcriptional regulator